MSTGRHDSRLGLGTKAIYGTGQFVDAVSSGVLSTFLLFYLNQVCGLPGALAGASLFLALFVDAFVDPLMGSISDNTTSAWGRRHGFMVLSIVPIVLGLGLLFSIPKGLGTAALFVYATAAALLLRVGLSGYIVPYIALGAELTDNYVERSSVVGWRMFFGVFASLTPIILGYSVFLSGTNLYSRAAYIPFGWTCAAIMGVLGAVAAFGTLSARDRLHKATPGVDHPLRRLFNEVVEVFRNPSFRLLFSSVLIFFVAQGTATALGLHGSKFFWKLTVGQIQLLAVAILAGAMAGIPLTALLGAHVEKKAMVIWSLVYIVVTQAGWPVLRIAGILPPGPITVVVLTGNSIVAGIAITFLTVGFQSMMADAADEHELLFGARREGLYFAGLSFSTKAASGLGGFIAGLALDAIAFPADLAAKGGDKAHLAVSTVNDLGYIYGIVPAAMTCACILLTMFYRIDRKAHASIQADLVVRRAEIRTEVTVTLSQPEN
ncbi:MAG TPA: MFS transporter [Rhizomicrobium sp.]|nr:MFS transporter [Rhizomicrobium sp.]